MMFRIVTDRGVAGHVVRLAGRLEGEGAAELAAVLAGLSGPVRVDGADLRSADEAGLEALRALRARGTRLTRLPRYWEFRLATGRPVPPPAPPGDPTADDDPAGGQAGGAP